MFERWSKRNKIPAIHQQDIEKIIVELGLSEIIEAKKISCSECGKSMEINDIQCLYKSGEEIKFCCDNIECYKKILNKKR